MKENLIKPIEYIGHNRCPICGNYLLIADCEMNYFQIDSDGFPINQTTAYSRCQGICSKCETAYDMKSVGLKYKYTSHMLDIIEQYENRKKLEKD